MPSNLLKITAMEHENNTPIKNFWNHLNSVVVEPRANSHRDDLDRQTDLLLSQSKKLVQEKLQEIEDRKSRRSSSAIKEYFRPPNFG